MLLFLCVFLPTEKGPVEPLGINSMIYIDQCSRTYDAHTVLFGYHFCVAWRYLGFTYVCVTPPQHAFDLTWHVSAHLWCISFLGYSALVQFWIWKCDLPWSVLISRTSHMGSKNRFSINGLFNSRYFVKTKHYDRWRSMGKRSFYNLIIYHKNYLHFQMLT